GADIFWTPNSSSNSATVYLSASITPCLNNVSQYPDITKAKVTFAYRNIDGSVTPVTGASNLPVSLANPGDPSVGTASAIVQMSLSSSAVTNSFQLAIIVGGDFKRNVPQDDTTITIAKPEPGGEIVGGGVILANSVTSGGTLAAEAGTNVNFSYGISFTKSLTNPQGQAIVMVTAANGHTYQIKSNSISTLQVVNPGDRISNGTIDGTCHATKECAMFTSKSSIVDLTTGASIDGGSPFQLTMSDNGASGDTLGITVNNAKTGGLWFSSNWNANVGKTIEAVAVSSNGTATDTITVTKAT
ncbi:MAG TPA: hypothetical protein VK457_10905, partial [Chloroflexota bacterium]|nr:hypothetical protein [Chloroflexota bacterium]